MFYDMASWLAHLDRRVAVANYNERVRKGLALLEAEEAKQKAQPQPQTPRAQR